MQPNGRTPPHRSKNPMTAWRSQVNRTRRVLRGKTAGEFAVTAGGSIAISLLSALAGVLAARLLGPSGRGELAAAMVWAGILGTVAHVGLPQALTYFAAKRTEALGAIFKAALLLCALQSIGILLIGWFLVDLVLGRSQPAAVGTVQLYLLSIPPTMLVTYLATLGQGVRDFRVFNILRVSSPVSYVLAVGLALLLQLHAARYLVLIMVVVQILLAAGAFVWFYARIRPRGHFDWSWVRRLIGYGLRSYSGSLSWIANARIDQFVMSAFVSLESLGQYAVAVSYAGVLFPLLSAFAMVLFPHVAGGPRETAGRKIKVALALNLSVACTGALILGALAGFIIPLLFGAEFTPAIVPAVILLAGTVVLSGNYVLSDGLRGLGQPLIPSLGEVIGLAVTLIALYMLLPRLRHSGSRLGVHGELFDHVFGAGARHLAGL